MKLKDIFNMEYYLKYECYCPGEIYSVDGFFYQIFKPEAEYEMIIESKDYDNFLSKIPCMVVLAKNSEGILQILIIMYEEEEIKDIIRFDATENNIRLVKEGITKGKTDLKFNEYEEGKTAKGIKEMLEIADAITYS